MNLSHLTLTQLERLYRNAYTRMSAGDGYQPYGYDWITLRLTRPGWHATLKSIALAIQAKRMDTTDARIAA